MDFGGLFRPKTGETNKQSGNVPIVGQMMKATKGATDAFSGVNRHVNRSLRTIRTKAEKTGAGIGYGVGFSHGFGVGLAVKPGVVQNIQAYCVQVMIKMMMKAGMLPNLPIGRGALPSSLQSSLSMINDPANKKTVESIMQLSTKLADHTSQDLPGLGNTGLGPLGNIGSDSIYEGLSSKTEVDTTFGSPTERILGSSLQNPVLTEEDIELNQVAGRLRSENNILQMVLKHQQVIGQLTEDNDKVRQVLVEDLNVPPSKLQGSHSSTNISPCWDCPECRRKQRRK